MVLPGHETESYVASDTKGKNTTLREERGPLSAERDTGNKATQILEARETWENNGVFHTDIDAYERERDRASAVCVYIYAILVRELSRKKRFNIK